MSDRYSFLETYYADWNARRDAAGPRTAEQLASEAAALEDASQLCDALAARYLDVGTVTELHKQRARTARYCANAIRLMRDSIGGPEHGDAPAASERME